MYVKKPYSQKKQKIKDVLLSLETLCVIKLRNLKKKKPPGYDFRHDKTFIGIRATGQNARENSPFPSLLRNLLLIQFVQILT